MKGTTAPNGGYALVVQSNDRFKFEREVAHAVGECPGAQVSLAIGSLYVALVTAGPNQERQGD